MTSPNVPLRVAVLPIRGLADGKSRLRPILPDRWRRAVILALAERVARAVVASGVIELLVVVSPDPQVLAWAERLDVGIVTLRQTNHGLIAALWVATNWARSQGATALLALNADLPLVTPASIAALVAHVPTGCQPALIVAGDRHRQGTNALLVQPPGSVSFRFGEASYARHIAEGVARAIPVQTFADRTVAFDLDTPADLRALAINHPRAFIGLWHAAARCLAVVRALQSTVIYHPAISPSEAHS